MAGVLIRRKSASRRKEGRPVAKRRGEWRRGESEEERKKREKDK